MSFRSDLLDQMSSVARDTLEGIAGVTLSYVTRECTAISLTSYPGTEGDELSSTVNLDTQETLRPFFLPGQAGLLAFPTTKALTTNVATITTREAHGFVVNQMVRIVLDTADSVFDGEQIVTTVPTSTTFTFAKTNANVASTAATGYAEAHIFIGDKITFESVSYEVRRITNPGIRVLYRLDCARVLPIAAGTY